MQQGRGGMGSHKHGVSGRAGKSPRLRLQMRMEAEKDGRRLRRRRLPYETLAELLSRVRPR